MNGIKEKVEMDFRNDKSLCGWCFDKLKHSRYFQDYRWFCKQNCADSYREFERQMNKE